MDMSTSCSPMQLQDASSLFFDCQDLLKQAYDPSSDPGYFSCCSSLSPTSSVDSFCFSPTSLPYGANRQEPLDCFIYSSPVSEVKEKPQTSPLQEACTRKPRSRYPGKKRQTASEREKLRMRDLTKALHHLRSYLPTSVVPAGQTLTKIETLRLTIRYISFLSAQLGLSEDGLCQGNIGAGTQTQNLSQNLSQTQTQNLSQTQTQNLSLGQIHSASGYIAQEPCYDAMEAVDESFSNQQSSTAPHFSTLPQSYQIPRNVYYSQTTAQDHWEPLQQQQQQFIFSGHC
ncbi:mesoderm posterior aa [Osmerus eperlanus]|uniref:mesoderm posterior aa n=1 Tax=Osmerus eperlanus TaxID=29151 RepID=UPI002E11D904